MGHVEWEEVTSGSGNKNRSGSGNSGKFLKLEANKEYLVRPVHRPIKFFKFFNKLNGNLRTAICKDPDSCNVTAKHPDLKPSRRYAILVLDRNDDNKLKILEGPQQIFEGFKKFWDITKEEPGGPNGGEFSIKVNCPNGKKDRKTTYEVEFQGKAPFTSDEKKMLKEAKEDFNLPEMFKAQDDEKIETMLFDPEWPPKSDDSQSGSSNSNNDTVNANVESDNEEDPFDW